MSEIKVGGVEKFSAVDFPEKLTAVVFMQGCPWKCPFCHNASIRDLTKENKLAGGDLKAIKVIKMPFATFESFFKINPFDAFPNLECVIVAYTGDQLKALQSMNIYKEYGFSVSAKDDKTVTYLLDSTVKSLLLNTAEFSNMLKNDEFAKYNNLDEIKVVGTKELIKKIKKR